MHRYYLKNNHSTDPLIPDEMIGELLKESQITLLQLNAPEVAWQLTLEDFKVFREIEPTEYVDELFELDSKYGCPMIRKFAEVRQFLFWVQLFLRVRLEVRQFCFGYGFSVYDAGVETVVYNTISLSVLRN